MSIGNHRCIDSDKTLLQPSGMQSMMTVHLEQKEIALTEPYLIIEDPHERLQAVLDSTRSPLAYADADKTDQWRVQGCLTPVWLQPQLCGGRCRFPVASSSATVEGLAALICQLYDNELPRVVAEHEHTLFARLRIHTLISTSRHNGLAALRGVIRQFALTHI